MDKLIDAAEFEQIHRRLAVKKCAPRAPGACFNRLSHRCEGLKPIAPGGIKKDIFKEPAVAA